jgi:NAD(P)-dependent dehydrogenase (short-subunit alcohol dehydrogenase family)
MTNEGNRVVLITGGGQGIGLECARKFFADGDRVVLGDINPSVTEVARDEFGESDRSMGVVMDVSDEDSVSRAVAEIRDALGSVDVLVNNASLFADVPFQRWDEVDLDLWDRIMAVNLRGPFVCARQVLPGMIEKKWGRIVNIGSSSSIVGMPLRLHYTASKGGVVSLTRSLARAVGNDGVTVNCVAPGATRSDAVLRNYSPEMLERLMEGRSIVRPELPADVAGGVVFLASESAGFITGQTLVVDGGAAFL